MRCSAGELPAVVGEREIVDGPGPERGGKRNASSGTAAEGLDVAEVPGPEDRAPDLAEALEPFGEDAPHPGDVDRHVLQADVVAEAEGVDVRRPAQPVPGARGASR